VAYLKAAEKKGVADDVFNQLIGNISDKTWPEGGKIPSENELAKTFRVSRVSVRAAIQRLIALGILESYQGGGTYVARQNGRQAVHPLITGLAVNPISVAELIELREAIEVAICGHAALRADAADLNKLKEILENMSAAVEKGQTRKYCKADMEFHLALAHACGNSAFRYIYEMIQDTIYEHFIDNANRYGRFDSLKFHYDVYKAINKKDAAAAVRAMKKILAAIRVTPLRFFGAGAL
jgi:GntR family transcriptional repressor for pyruvate dehydrogenase complex